MAAQNPFELPGPTDRISIMGHTGSGKTQFAAFMLSHAPLDRMPYIIVDYKGDELLNDIPYLREIGYKDRPKEPGLYIIHPRPDEQEQMEQFLWNIWERGKTGLYVDEAYMLPNAGPTNRGAYVSILTQGRSKRIPVMSLTQRPRDVTRFHFTEANFYSIFHLQDKTDRKRVMEFVPANLEHRLPRFHSFYHRVKDQHTIGLRPVPDGDTILERFSDRLRPKHKLV